MKQSVFACPSTAAPNVNEVMLAVRTMRLIKSVAEKVGVAEKVTISAPPEDTAPEIQLRTPPVVEERTYPLVPGFPKAGSKMFASITVGAIGLPEGLQPRTNVCPDVVGLGTNPVRSRAVW